MHVALELEDDIIQVYRAKAQVVPCSVERLLEGTLISGARVSAMADMVARMGNEPDMLALAQVESERMLKILKDAT